MTDECLADLESYMSSHPRGKDGRVVYDLEGDFGVSADELRRRFAFYPTSSESSPKPEKPGPVSNLRSPDCQGG